MPSPSTAALIRGLENHQQKTHRFWRAYTRLVLAGQAPESARALGEALQRKHRQAVVLIGHSARERRGNVTKETGATAEQVD